MAIKFTDYLLKYVAGFGQSDTFNQSLYHSLPLCFQPLWFLPLSTTLVLSSQQHEIFFYCFKEYVLILYIEHLKSVDHYYYIMHLLLTVSTLVIFSVTNFLEFWCQIMLLYIILIVIFFRIESICNHEVIIVRKDIVSVNLTENGKNMSILI